MLEWSETRFVPLLATKIDLGFPVSLTFSEDSTKILITTNKRALVVLDHRTNQLITALDGVVKLYWNKWDSKFTLVTKNPNSALIPVSLGHVSNVVGAGDEFGNVHIYASPENVRNNVGLNFTGHSSLISSTEFTIDDSKFITAGSGDETVLQWRLENLYSQLNR
jgi:WD40 repeat protein